MTPERSEGERRVLTREGRLPTALWGGAVAFTSVCVWLQTSPDLLEELPRTVLVWMTALGAFGQAMAAVVYPEIALRFRRGRVRPLWRPRPGNNLLPPLEHFVGYGAEQLRMRRLFSRFPRSGWRRLLHISSWGEDDGSGHPALVVVITGAPGAGKSQFANKVAREFSDRFPGGVRWMNLSGHKSTYDEADLELDEENGPVEPDGRHSRWSVLQRFARRAPGTAEPEPAGDPGRHPGPYAPRKAHNLLEEVLDSVSDRPRGPRRQLEQAWRRLTAGRRLLLVLENATDPRQIARLLPNSAMSAVLVTSRRSFVDAHFDWETVELSGFSGEVGLELLERLAPVTGSPEEREEENELRRRIVERCHGLPIALGMCGKRLASPSGGSARELLATLESTDWTPLVHAQRGFRASFTAAFQQCAPRGRLLLRFMAVAGMGQVADFSAAALLNLPRRDAWEVIEDLQTRFLLEPLGQADDGVYRYQLHQLVRDTLRTRSPEDFDLPATEARAWGTESTHAARVRLLQVYTWLAEQAAAGLTHAGGGTAHTQEAPRELAERLGITPPGDSRAWLEREREYLLGCVWLAEMDGHLELGRRLARAVVAMCLVVRTHWEEWGEAVRAQRSLVEAEGDRHAVAMALLDESEYVGARGDYDRGVGLAQAARDEFDERGAHPRWQARALRALGVNLQRKGDLEDARKELVRAEAVFAEHSENWWQARTQCNIAEVDTDIGDYADAQRQLEQARDAFDAEGDTDQREYSRILLAEVLTRRGNDLESWRLLQEVRERAEQEGRQWYVAQCLRVMGALDSVVLERQYRRLAVVRSRREGPRPHGLTVWRRVRAYRRSWSYRARVAMLEEAIELLERMGDMWGVHWARLTLGRVQVRDGRFATGARTLERATEGFAQLPDKLWRARAHRIIAEELLAATISREGGGLGSTGLPPRLGVWVSTPRFRNSIATARDHAEKALAAYSEISDHVGQIHTRLLMARLVRAASAPRDEIHAPLGAAEALVKEHGEERLAREVARMRRALVEEGAEEHAEVSRFWPIS